MELLFCFLRPTAIDSTTTLSYNLCAVLHQKKKQQEPSYFACILLLIHVSKQPPQHFFYLGWTQLQKRAIKVRARAGVRAHTSKPGVGSVMCAHPQKIVWSGVTIFTVVCNGCDTVHRCGRDARDN